MKKIVLLLLCLLIVPFLAYAEPEPSIFDTVKADYSNFYSVEMLTNTGLGLAVGGIIANTNIDSEFRSEYQDNVKSNTTDDVAKLAKKFGEGSYLIPLVIGASLLPEGYFVSEWGRDSSRAYLVGAPAMLSLQLLTGASRPEESDSHWKPFNDNNGVSGHAFMGAVPFITAANRVDNVYLKSLLYVGSTLTAWSRVNDDDHYLSQAVLGWFVAYQSASAINKTNGGSEWLVMPMAHDNAVGLTFVKTF